MSEGWLHVAARLCSAARGNDRFVGVRPLGRLMSAWAAAQTTSPLTTTVPTLDAQTGLPLHAVWTDLMSEHRIGKSLGPATAPAPAPLADVEDARRDDARTRLYRREAAARILAAAPPLTLVEGRVEVRRVDADDVTVALSLDRVASGLFVRLSADVVLPLRTRGESSGIVVDDDRARAAAPLLALLGRSVQLPAPAIAVQVAALGELRLLRLSRGVVGPMSVHGQGAALSMYAGDDGALLALSFEELSVPDDGQPTIVDNDVFATGDLKPLMGALPASLAHLRAFRDARVVATAPAAARVRDAAVRRGLQTVIAEV
jgi:hypothetical protein